MKCSFQHSSKFPPKVLLPILPILLLLAVAVLVLPLLAPVAVIVDGVVMDSAVATLRSDWEGCFDREFDVEIDGGTIHVYEKGNSGPVVLLLHGAGLSSMSFALFSMKLFSKSQSCRIIAFDWRGHGFTKMETPSDLSVDTLCNDVEALCEQVVKKDDTVIVVGHSMGGAMAVHAVSRNKIPNVAALCVIDVVEATALMSLSAMSRVIQARPTSFDSMEDAVSWCVKTKTVRNEASARISMPGQLKWVPKTEVGLYTVASLPLTFHEEEEEDGTRDEGDLVDTRNQVDDEMCKEEGKHEKLVLTWAVNLNNTKPYWEEWFRGVSQRFLACGCGKLLITAGADRLTDKTLIIGQMQGKFQMHIVRDTGHCVQEDAPDNLVEVINGFINRVLVLSKVTQKK
eukprot:m.88819 g.88819  ORF g.88819 m.88819 type:complete len:399 (-) comp8816_c5_seq1:86-1282(-)